MVLAGLALAACEPGDGPATSMAQDGRVRLNATKSYADFGNFVVHLNGMTSADLTPEVASTYGITRAEDRALINLVVLRKTREIGMDQPVRADVEVKAANLTGQSKNVQLREIVDGPSIYYIGVLTVENRETINFDLDIRPTDSDRSLRVRFNHEFYTR